MTTPTLAERAAAKVARATAPGAEPEAAAPTYRPEPLADLGIPEPGPDGPPTVPVYIAWSNVMGTVTGIAKSGQYGNPGATGSYRFRGIDAALNAFGPACRLHGVLVLPVRTEAGYRDVKTSTGKNSRECTVTVTYRIIGPAGDHIEVQSVGESMDSADKGTAKALSTSLRSLLLLGGLVPTGDADPDSQNVERGEAPTRSIREYLDEIFNPASSTGRLRQIRYELGQQQRLMMRVQNETGETEEVGKIIDRVGKERAAGGVQ
ncbi:ERF family protein [Kitasatospora sp. McL0602]|uniref:ERF family protein n=1 Tax=Kitasatospora sp. McL0602 TaxID=3439530 RepID=UPI003F8905FD